MPSPSRETSSFVDMQLGQVAELMAYPLRPDAVFPLPVIHSSPLTFSSRVLGVTDWIFMFRAEAMSSFVEPGFASTY